MHTEMGYLDPEDLGKKAAAENKKIFDGIATVLGQYVGQGNQAYYLAEESESSSSRLIYPPIQKHFPPMQYIPYGDSLESQFLRTKDLLLLDEAEKISLVGVSYYGCLQQLQYLLSGKTNRLRRSEYDDAREILIWSPEKFERIFRQPLPAVIQEELTDK